MQNDAEFHAICKCQIMHLSMVTSTKYVLPVFRCCISCKCQSPKVSHPATSVVCFALYATVFHFLLQNCPNLFFKPDPLYPCYLWFPCYLVNSANCCVGIHWIWWPQVANLLYAAGVLIWEIMVHIKVWQFHQASRKTGWDVIDQSSEFPVWNADDALHWYG